MRRLVAPRVHIFVQVHPRRPHTTRRARHAHTRLRAYRQRERRDHLRRPPPHLCLCRVRGSPQLLAQQLSVQAHEGDESSGGSGSGSSGSGSSGSGSSGGSGSGSGGSSGAGGKPPCCMEGLMLVAPPHPSLFPDEAYAQLAPVRSAEDRCHQPHARTTRRAPPASTAAADVAVCAPMAKAAAVAAVTSSADAAATAAAAHRRSVASFSPPPTTRRYAARRGRLPLSNGCATASHASEPRLARSSCPS
jgi:hypothetical protein